MAHRVVTQIPQLHTIQLRPLLVEKTPHTTRVLTRIDVHAPFDDAVSTTTRAHTVAAGTRPFDQIARTDFFASIGDASDA